jgi:hypothetical protein
MRAQPRPIALACLAEAGTGLFVLVEPALFARLLLAVELPAAGLAIARLAGIALLALAVACWPPHQAPAGKTAGLGAILLYNVVVTPYLALLGVGDLAGGLLWPAVMVHGLLSVLLAQIWLRAT